MEPQVLSFQLLEKITNGFSEERKLGRGAFGTVYKGVHKNGEEIAVKRLRDQLGLDDEQFCNEFDNLMMLKHPNIVQLVGYCYETRREHIPYNGKLIFAESTFRALCFEYMQNGSLREHLFEECDGLDWHTRYKIIKGICEGLKYLHEGLDQAIYHLDLKPDNILLDNKMMPKLADFGLSKLFGEEQTRITQSAIGTMRYLPREYIERNIVSIKLDIFSLGVIIIEIMTGPMGYSRCDEMPSQQFVELVHDNWRKRLQEQSRPESLEACCQQVKRCIEIALKCVEINRKERPCMRDIIHQLNETETMIYDAPLCSNGAGSQGTLNCLEIDKTKRPYMRDIIHQLNETETMIHEVSLCSNEAGSLGTLVNQGTVVDRPEEREQIAQNYVAKWQRSSFKTTIQIASWDTRFELGTKATLLLPFSPIVVAADENEQIRVWNYDDAQQLNNFENHNYDDAQRVNNFENHKLSERGLSKLLLINELDECLLLVGSSNGNVRIWRNYTQKGGQELVTAFSSVQGHRAVGLSIVMDWQKQSGYLYVSGNMSSIFVWDLDKEQLLHTIQSSGQKLVTAFSSVQGYRAAGRSIVMDWQEQSGYLYASGNMSSIFVRDLDKEQLLHTIQSSADSGVSALAASQVQYGQFAAGFSDASLRIFDVRTPDRLVCMARPHAPKTEKVVGIGFQPGFDPYKVVSASQAGDILFIDVRRADRPYIYISAHRGSLTALAVHRHAPVIASGSAKQIIKVFSLDGEQLTTIRYHPSIMGLRIGRVNCLSFHPYKTLLAAGAGDNALVSVYARTNGIR